MDNLTELITAAVDDVNTGGDDGDTGSDSVSDGAAHGAVEGASPERAGAGPAGTTDDSQDTPDTTTTPTPVSDELAKELEELGLKAPEEGQRENRIPYSRVKKIVENARKKLADSHAAALTEHQTKAQKAEARAREADIADEAARKDPARYLEILTAINPEFKKYIVGRSEAATTPAAANTPAKVVEEPPAPDHTFADGSLGYTPEGAKKYNEWLIRQAEDRAVERWRQEKAQEDAQREATTQANQKLKETTQEWVARASKLWGKAFDDEYKLNEKSEIYTYLQANPTVPFDAAVAAVLIPRMQADRDKIRKDTLDELNARPNAATKTVSGGRKPAEVASSGSRSMEDVIREAIATHGLHG